MDLLMIQNATQLFGFVVKKGQLILVYCSFVAVCCKQAGEKAVLWKLAC